MSKSATANPAPKTKTHVTTTEGGKPAGRRESARDFVEQVVVALILAFLVKGFEAEAFVIPTGSMAPTLMGQHKDLECPQCKHRFTLNASSEEGEAAALIVDATCGNCRARFRVDEAPSFKGDRILVNKFLYAFPFMPNGGKPERWSVIVFHYPEKPEMNYIKRLVGLPGETIRIFHGDIHTRPMDAGAATPFLIERRPLGHQSAMQMHVFDDRNRARSFADLPEWRRWRPMIEQGFVETEPATYAARGAAAGAGAADRWNEMRYQHLVPTDDQWAAVISGRPVDAPRPSLITDYYAYNMGIKETAARDGRRYQSSDFRRDHAGHWVGDLTMHAKVRTDSVAASGRVKLELFEAGVSHRVEFDLAKGTVQFFRGERPLAEPVEARLGDGKPHDLSFANVDDRLTLWIDGRTPFGTGAGVTFDRDPIESRAPTAEDLSPARVGVSGDASVVVSDLVLQRDIYYSLDPRESSRGDYARLGIDPSLESMSDVSVFPLIDHLQPRDFTVRPKHYFMLGDNSPRSADSRGWRDADQMLRDPNSGEVIAGWDPNVREPWELPESLILGKAFYIYWPHGVPVWPNIPLTRDLRVPFRPNVERMRFIR